MTGKVVQSLGLFLSVCAAFSLALGRPQVALGDTEKPAPAPERGKLTGGRDASAKARLAARMRAVGYTEAEANERIRLLTDEEIAELADDPDAMASGTGVTTVVLICSLVFVAALVAWYFVAAEPVEPPAPEAPPAK